MTSDTTGQSVEVDLAWYGSRVVRVCAAWAFAIGMGVLLTPLIPGSLPRTTGVAGYPAAFGFDVLRYRNVYVLWAVAVPLVALGAHRLLLRIDLPKNSDSQTIRILALTPERAEHDGQLSSAARAGFLGLVIGAQVGVVSARWSWSPWPPLVIGLSLGAVIGWLAIRQNRRRALSGKVQVGLGMVSILGLYGVSRSVWVTVGVTETRVYYPILPFSLVLVAMVAFVLVSLVLARRRTDGWVPIERCIARFVSPSLLLLTVVPRLPGVLPSPDLFHDGERLGAARLLLDGNLPWRDFLSIHGVLYDSLFPMVGFRLIDESYWGSIAVNTLLITPLYVVFLYLLLATLIKQNWFFLGTCFALLLLTSSNQYVFPLPVHDRMILFFPVLIVMIMYLKRGGWFLGAGFMTLMFAQTVMVPESAYLVPAAFVVIVLCDLQDPNSRGLVPKWRRFDRTICCGAVGLVLTSMFALWLAVNGALGGFVESITTFASDHALTGGIPIMWGGFVFAVAAFVPPVVSVLTYSACWVKWRKGQRLSAEELGMLALALFLLPYYTKFLYRGDGHVYQPFAMSLPLIAYAVYRLVAYFSEAMRHIGVSRLAGLRVSTLFTIPVVLFALFPWAPAWRTSGWIVDNAAVSLQPQVQTLSSDPDLGYADSTLDDAIIPDLQSLLGKATGRSLSVFDFTNQPGLYTFLLDLETPTRFYHVSMAIRDQTQRTLIAELEEAPPDVVVMQSSIGGLSAWDGIPNIVRHHDVSDWILRNYRPWLNLHGQVLYQRSDLTLPEGSASELGLLAEPSDVDAVADVGACTFHELAERSPIPTDIRWINVSTEPVDEMVTVSGWVGRDGVAATEVLVLDGDRVVATTRPMAPDPAIAASLGLAEDTAVGFSVLVPMPEGGRDLRIAATYPNGMIFLAASTDTNGGTPATGETLELDDGSSFKWSQGSGGRATTVSVPANPDGTVQLADGTNARIERLLLPEAATGSSWFSVGAAKELTEDEFLLTDRLDDSRRFITFDAVYGGPVTVQVGACPQWKERVVDVMYLVHRQGPDAVLEVRTGVGTTE